MAGIQPGGPTPGVDAGQAVPASDKSAVADGAPRSDRGPGADNGRAFDQAVVDGKAADRPASNSASPNGAANTQAVNGTSNAQAPNAAADASASSSSSNVQPSNSATATPASNAIANTPTATTAADAAVLNSGNNAPAVNSPPNAAVASGPTNAPVGNGVSNAPVANGAVNPSASNGSPTPVFAANRADAPLANGAASPTASTVASMASNVTPPPLAKEGAPRLDGQLRFEPPSRADGAQGRGGVSPSNGTGERPNAGVFDLPVLRLGASDSTVGLLQRALGLLGFLELLSERGFGAKTDQAVRSFQEGLGLARDGVVGNRETWPAINKALVTRHEGITRLADAMTPGVSLGLTQTVELKQLAALLGEFSERAIPTALGKEIALMSASARESATPALSMLGEAAFAGRMNQTMADAARALALPVSALIAANPELTRSYLVLQGQLLAMPNPVRERRFRSQPKQLHPADPDGHLADAKMNPDFVALVNGMIAELRSEGHDVRVVAGFRSFSDQQVRFEQGRIKPGTIATKAEAGHSWHNYGLAVDIILNDDDGNPAWPEASSSFWQRLADAALARGAIWGGRFGFPAHVEYHPALGRSDAGSLIEDFESFGLEMVWARALEVPEPEDGEEA